MKICRLVLLAVFSLQITQANASGDKDSNIRPFVKRSADLTDKDVEYSEVTARYEAAVKKLHLELFQIGLTKMPEFVDGFAHRLARTDPSILSISQKIEVYAVFLNNYLNPGSEEHLKLDFVRAHELASKAVDYHDEKSKRNVEPGAKYSLLATKYERDLLVTLHNVYKQVGIELLPEFAPEYVRKLVVKFGANNVEKVRLEIARYGEAFEFAIRALEEGGLGYMPLTAHVYAVNLLKRSSDLEAMRNEIAAYGPIYELLTRDTEHGGSGSSPDLARNQALYFQSSPDKDKLNLRRRLARQAELNRSCDDSLTPDDK